MDTVAFCHAYVRNPAEASEMWENVAESPLTHENVFVSLVWEGRWEGVADYGQVDGITDRPWRTMRKWCGSNKILSPIRTI